jgi:putative hydrolase of the HAD superfamily
VIKYVLFDLDNTLYSCRNGLEEAVARRIREYTAGFLGISVEEAWQMRKANMRQYGTCLEWLMTEKGLSDVESYFAFIHPDDEADTLLPDPQLRAFLESIPVPKAILTNSPCEHADLILAKLALGDIFTNIFDIRQCNFLGKPRREVFENALRVLGRRAEEVLFIDDSPFYVEGFIAIGGRGVLLDEKNIHQDVTLPKIHELKELTRFID